MTPCIYKSENSVLVVIVFTVKAWVYVTNIPINVRNITTFLLFTVRPQLHKIFRDI